jgi:hypothetical protein
MREKRIDLVSPHGGRVTLSMKKNEALRPAEVRLLGAAAVMARPHGGANPMDTHGGQIRVPFFGAIVVPSRHEGRYASGFHQAGNVLMYVSRGIGAIPPIRILCKPEVATFTLRSSPKSGL